MTQRITSVALILLAWSVTTLANAGGDGKDKKGTKTGHAHDPMFEKCAKACNDCQRICDACATHCAHLVAAGKKEHLTTLRTCMDCATFCAAAAQIVGRSGPFSDLICKSCADACNRCGKACEKHKDDEMMRRCAEECFRCEKACREMVMHAGHHHHDAGETKGTPAKKPE